jgi:hypothetical protein
MAARTMDGAPPDRKGIDRDPESRDDFAKLSG